MKLSTLKDLANNFNAYLNGDTSLFEKINKLNESKLTHLLSKYESDAKLGNKPVNLLRYIILKQIEQGDFITSESLEKLKEQLENREVDVFDFLNSETKGNFKNYPQKTRSFFVNWSNPGSILFPFLYNDELKEEVNDELDSMLNKIVNDLDLRDINTHKVDFFGTQNYGSGRVWGAIYPETKSSHQAAYQLFFSVSHNGLEGGLYSGANIPNHLAIDDRNLFTSLDGLIDFLREKVPEWKSLNGKDISEEKAHKQLEQFKVPLNQIYYGPPGTGKTYHTVSEAVKIVEEISDVELKNEYSDRNILKKVFDNYVKKGQIAFTTFHQSMGYEDFIEGIKPKTVLQSNGDTQVTYEVQPGIFKKLCQNAEGYKSTKQSIQETDQSKFDQEEWEQAIFYKMSLGDTTQQEDESIYEYCIKNNSVALGWGGDVDYSDCETEDQIKVKAKANEKSESDARFIKMFKLYLKKGNYIVVTNGNYKFRAIGKVIGDYEYRPEAGIDYFHFRNVDWILKNVNFNYSDLYDRQFQQATLYKLQEDAINYSFFNQFKAENKTAIHQDIKEVPAELVKRNHVLIIDEINRGNVSQIFGELITLLEEDKRKGNKEELIATLPYSQKSFGIPNNIYLIGTMNTADRSVEALDTALRRRFAFREMPPQPELLSPEKAIFDKWMEYENDWENLTYLKEIKILTEFTGYFIEDVAEARIWQNLDDLPEIADIEAAFKNEAVTFSGIHLKKMLIAINNRIEKLLSRDHTIGHAYFMEVYQAENPLAALRLTFHKNIVPLLQEYFYGDYAKIGLILGEPFVKIKEEEKSGFAKSFKEIDEGLKEDYASKRIFELTSMDTWKKEDFIAIYS